MSSWALRKRFPNFVDQISTKARPQPPGLNCWLKGRLWVDSGTPIIGRSGPQALDPNHDRLLQRAASVPDSYSRRPGEDGRAIRELSPGTVVTAGVRHRCHLTFRWFTRVIVAGSFWSLRQVGW